MLQLAAKELSVNYFPEAVNSLLQRRALLAGDVTKNELVSIKNVLQILLGCGSHIEV